MLAYRYTAKTLPSPHWYQQNACHLRKAYYPLHCSHHLVDRWAHPQQHSRPWHSELVCPSVIGHLYVEKKALILAFLVSASKSTSNALINVAISMSNDQWSDRPIVLSINRPCQSTCFLHLPLLSSVPRAINTYSALLPVEDF